MITALALQAMPIFQRPVNLKQSLANCMVALLGCQQFPEWKFKGKIGTSVSGEEITFGDLFYKNIYNGSGRIK